MRTGLFWLLSFGGFAAVSLLCGILVWPQLVAAWPSIEEKIDRFRRLPPFAKLVLLLFVGVFVVYGSTKTNQVDQTSGTNIVEIVEGGTNDVEIVDGGETNAPPMMLMMAMPFSGDQPPTVTPEDIARGWQLWEVRTNLDICYTMPEGAMMASNWWVRGAYEDCSIVRLGDCSIGCCANQSNNQNNPNNRTMSFPFGTNEYSSLWAFSWGKLRFALGDTNTEIVAVGAPMSAVPYRSRLWSAADTNGAKVVTWENFALGRVGKEEVLFDSSGETPLPRCANAQIELKRNGDFIVRSNDVETVCRRVDPDDYDGDGWENGDDPDPYNWDEFYEDFWQELPAGDYACNYCWIEIRPQWNSWIVFTGDGPSNLEDPCFWGKAGETYRVQLLIGKTYDVTSSQPLSVVGRSNEAIEVSESGPCSFSVVWPVTFTVGEGRYAARPLLGATLNDGGKSFYVLRDPAFLRGTNVWWGGCCSISGDGTNFNFTCNNTCACEGCTAYGYFTYSGYTLDLPDYFECGCHYVPDEGPAEVSISFDRSAVIYEDTYTNMPDEVVHPVRSNAVLRCSVSGGTYGGTLSVTLSDAAHQKLRMVRGDILPTNERIEPGNSRSYEVVYAVLEPSDSVRDIQATAVFLEDFLNETHTGIASMTSVKVELEAKYAPPISADLLNRHLFGVYEVVKYRHRPASASVDWEFAKGSQILTQTHYAGDGDVFLCPSRGGEGIARASCDSVDYIAHFRVIEPSVEARNIRVNVSDVVAERGNAGQLLMFMDMYLLPGHVSFKGLWIQEVPDDSQGGSHFGYYNDQSKGGDWSHVEDLNYGAGRWNETSASGYYGTDKAGTTRSYALEWTYGWKEWDIPMAWAANGNGGGSERFNPNPTTQKFTLWPDGTFKIEKHNHWAQRTIWNSYTIDGISILEDGL